MPIINVMPSGHTYLADELRDKGYTGKLEAIPNACVLVIPKPGAKSKDIAESLDYLVRDFQHRARLEGENGDPKDQPLEIPCENLLEINGREYRVYLNLETKRFRQEPMEK